MTGPFTVAQSQPENAGRVRASAPNWAPISLAVASLVILVTCVVPGRPSAVLFALSSTLFPFLLIALGVARGGRLGPVRWPLALLVALALGSVGGMLWFAGQVGQGPRWWGLPAGVVLQLIGLGLLPMLVSSLGYAWTFDSWALRASDLEELQRRTGGSAAEPEVDPPRSRTAHR